ncbi:MAG: hypothetical protein ABIM40_08385, partial [Pseudomonadota bacterium]
SGAYYPLNAYIIFEAPLDDLEAVADLTARVMKETMMEFFPELRPRVEIDISNPESWGVATRKEQNHVSIIG